MWNRLAIVATVLAVIIAPLWLMATIISSQAESRDALYRLCMGFAESGPPAEYGAAIEKCSADRLSDPYRPGMQKWREFALGTLVVCATIYGLIWLAVWTVKWVWRGRFVDTAKPPSP